MVLKNISPGCGVRASLMLFYCTAIAYHVELNAYSGGCRHLANVQEKWTQIVARCSGIEVTPVVTLTANMESVPFFFKERDLILYGYTCCWILKLHQFFIIYHRILILCQFTVQISIFNIFHNLKSTSGFTL